MATGRQKVGIGLGVALVVGVFAYVLTEPPTSRDATPGADALVDGANTPNATLGTASEDQREAGGGRAQEPAEPIGLTRAQWESLKTALQQARTLRVEGARRVSEEGAGTENPTEPGSESDSVGTLDPSYIRDAVEAIKPLLLECYELALEADATLEGSLLVEFTVGGEPGVGGVIEESTVAEDSELRHPILDECVRETLYSIELPEPEQGGTVNVKFPLEFRASEEEAQDEGI